MNADRETKMSKFLSYVLRHAPESIDLSLDATGWVGVDELLAAAQRHGKVLSRAELEYVVANNAKKRFAFSADGLRIRANQGHSVEVDLAYAPAEPPEMLFHGTATRFLESIRRTGLLKQARHHVHLSADEATALAVGQRHGKPVVLRVFAAQMRAGGFVFFKSANGVWLTETVPPQYIGREEGTQ